MSTRSEILRLEGARLYYEVRGAGPVLLMIPGGPTDAGAFAALAGFLADRYTVVAYDPRGNSRSVVDGPPQDQRMDVHGDDAARLLATLDGAPAGVLGSSGGAQIGLNLVARYPGRVRTLIAHEPPCVELLPDAEEQRSFMQAVYDTHRVEGLGPAWAKFLSGTGMADRPGEERATGSPPPPETGEMMERIRGNLGFFLAHGVRAISGYLPDVAALRAGTTRVAVGIGETSRAQLAHRSALALAERLGVAPVTFPGGHVGHGDQAAAYAQVLDRVLRGE